MVYLQRWHGWCHMKLQPSRRKSSQCTPYNYAPCHFMQSHIRKVYACLAVTCHLHFWQNDRDLLRATAVTWGWNRHWNKSQHRKSTLEKKILPLLQQGFEPATFQSQVWRSNHWAIPVPTPPPTRWKWKSGDMKMEGWGHVNGEVKVKRWRGESGKVETWKGGDV